MIAKTEMERIFRSGCIDNRQIACLADALTASVGEAFASRFVNKQLDIAEIEKADAFPKSFSREKFLEVNQIWQRQNWNAKHRLANAAETAASAELRKKEAQRQVEQRDALKAAMAARKAAEDELNRVRSENDGLRADVERANKALELAESKRTAAEQAAEEQKAAKLKVEIQLHQIDMTFPRELVALCQRFAKILPSSDSSSRILYLYLALVAAEPIEGSRFVARFDLFDKELYRLLKDEAKRLQEVRAQFAEDLNARLLATWVTWNLLNESYDEKKFKTNDSTGTRVQEVVSALIMKRDGGVLRRAEVRTDIEA